MPAKTDSAPQPADRHTIGELIAWRAEAQPEAAALLAPDRQPQTYGSLFRHVESTVAALNRLGVGRNDRVALVLPNGPDLASAFVSLAAGAACAPLNPAYRTEEFDFYLADLEARALVIESGMESPALEVARARRIRILELEPRREAGSFEISAAPAGAPAGSPPTSGWAAPDDVALVLHTSGTTSRPKMVPLSHRNVCASAFHIARSLALTENDRCLNVMPLFHIHGLIGAILSTLAAGANVVCTPGFQAMKFFAWLDEFQPSWYTAVPTMHQAILARAARNRAIVEASRLRFVRSSSAALPPQVLAELETVFRAPVIESYGMTEAAHQMASNPLPPAVHKPGSVGLPAGPEIAIMDAEGRLLGRRKTGEVVIRGPNVTRGYENNPEANQTAFSNGWFRTGDQGYLDQEGYLFITGRLKELINRGGEKISPREVDEVLMDHPAVLQAVTFALPHEKLGEEVAAAIVVREGHRVSEKELRDYAAQRLADFKVPRKVVFLDEIPKGPTGKLQRIGLAQKLGLTPA